MAENRTFNVALAGNPNCGKTTFFNNLTGGTQRIGNWPGVTVEKIEGSVKIDNNNFNIVDLPGIYSLSAFSEDERVSRDYLLSRKVDLVLNIIDATNIERNLYLTTQLIEMQVPLIIVLNMIDLAKKKNIQIDLEHLQTHIGCPVIAISSTDKNDFRNVKNIIKKSGINSDCSKAEIKYQNEIEDIIQDISPKLNDVANSLGANKRWVAVKLIENDNWIRSKVIKEGVISESEIIKIQTKLEKILGDPPDVLIADYRYGFIHGIVRDVVKRKIAKKEFTERIDKVVLNRVFGIPILILVMYLIFQMTINFGGAFIDFFDILFGSIFVEGFLVVLNFFGSPDWLNTILAKGVGAGIQTVATFIPIIFMMFFMLSLLEDSGYMARAAFVMDRFMAFLGLPGKAFVPILVGFGCTVPAILATRTLENRRDRILTVMMTPFMSCGARLPVYTLFAAAFFAQSIPYIVLSLYLFGIFLAIVMGIILRKTLFQGEPEPFVMELPPYHTPRFRHIMFHTWFRLKSFLWRAGKVIVIMVLILGFLNSLGIDGSFQNENSTNSILTQIGKIITPIFKPMGIKDDNWPASVAIFTGIFAKEAVVGTLNGLYGQIDNPNLETKQSEDKFNFTKAVKNAFLSIPRNLLNYDESDASSDTEPNETSTLKSLQNRFDSKSSAYAYLLFILIYFPCIAAVGAAYRQIGGSLTVFLTLFLTVLAWIISTLFYQITYGHEILWIIIPILISAISIWIMKIIGTKWRNS